MERTSLSTRPWLMLTALLVLALNLRPTASAPGPVLDLIRADLGMSGAVAGLLTSLPVLCFAAFGALAPMLANRYGGHRVVLVSVVAMVVGQILRLHVPGQALFLAASVVALAGMAMANVLLPSLVKQHFPERIGLVTALYSTSIIVGLTAASMLTAPLALAAGGWRQAMWAWVLLALAAVGPWLVMLAHDRGHVPSHGASRISLSRVARTPLGWCMALFFGFQSGSAYSVFGWLASIYTDAGASHAAAGLYLGIATGVGIPLGFLLPAYTARKNSPYALLVAIGVGGAVGYLGLAYAPLAAPVAWALLVAIGTAAFPIFLALMGMRARTSEGTAALSAFAQSVGYLVAAPWPILMGVLRDATGSYHWPLMMLTAMLVPVTGFALLSSRPQWLEDQLPQR
ncbi:CynX/NimT family MFS transporter [Mariniluteicoccus endophyticus]